MCVYFRRQDVNDVTIRFNAENHVDAEVSVDANGDEC